ncbi:MAG: tetratricopeptide repeat protein [Nitrospirae bacterium]|nr:tetratricopeptide repeat protein [Nitrospirota bacterium]
MIKVKSMRLSTPPDRCKNKAGSGKAFPKKDLTDINNKGFTFFKIAKNRIVAGTPPWMAPEQFYGVADVRSDIYSFGIVMYQMLNKGKLPFQLKEGDDWQVAHKTYSLLPLKGEGSTALYIIEKCLQKRREKRYENFTELREDIELLFKKEITKKTGEKLRLPEEQAGIDKWEHINKGVSLANLGLVNEAIKQYKEGLSINQSNPSAHNNLGNALSQKGILDGAIKEYRVALAVRPDYAEAHNNLGTALFKKGLFDDAIDEYREALRIKTSYVEACYNLGIALVKKGNPNEAIKEGG